MDQTPYQPEFYDAVTEGSINSARAVVPRVLQLLGDSPPESIVDVGCGAAAWLSIFREHGVKTVVGLDGDYVPRSSLRIEPECFRAVDLTKPFTIERRFDLAMSLEVAEHLPHASAEDFVASLCRLASLVLFSAAVPGQGGTNHINEQWPWYWRHWFGKQGFRMFDPIRPLIFHDRRVEWWYRQNLYLFAHEGLLHASPSVAQFPEVVDDFGLQIVAPQILGPTYYTRQT